MLWNFLSKYDSQATGINPTKKSYKIFIDSHSYNYFRENSVVVTDRLTQLHVNAVMEIKFVQSAKRNEFIKKYNCVKSEHCQV